MQKKSIIIIISLKVRKQLKNRKENMDNTIKCVSQEQCTGCGACYNVCPTQAISMKEDTEGFLFPQIDTTLCVNCGKCLKTCPSNMPQYTNNAQPNCYAVMADDAVRTVSSSGGVFTLLAEWILECGGVVCGAAFTPDQYAVEHIIVTNRDELQLLRGSKYVQSDTNQIYRKVKEYLEQGKKVLFTGTPCQVAAVHQFIGQLNKNLYTLDLVCHGVPSPMVYKAFIQEQERKLGSKAVRVSFRDKDIVKWNAYTTAITFADGQKYQKKRNECAYMKSFLKLMTLRKSCGHCPFATLPRQGDMTIADFWDIHRFNEKLDDQKGTSMVLTNNAKGREMLEVLKKYATVCVEAPLEHAVKYNAQIKYSSVLNPRRDRFFDLLNNYHYGFEKAVDYGMNRRFDIGYVGWWYGNNYGSALTNYALNRVLTGMGQSVLMLEWPVLSGDVSQHKPDNKTRRFANHFYEQSMRYRLDDYGRFNYHCNTFLVGSDQLWNWWSNRDVGSYHFFLDFADDQHKKIAYSTSFGHDSAYYPSEMKLKIGYLLQRFDAVSVREYGAVDVCKHDYDVDAVQTVDPVFLCSQSVWEEAIALSKVSIDGEYVLAYILNPTEDKINATRHVAEKLNLPYYIILDGQGDFEELKAQTNDDHILDNVEIADWLVYLKNASYVITDSFHGFCFSIIFKRNMSVFPNALRGLSRFESLCKMTDLSDRMVSSLDEMIQKTPWKYAVDFNKVSQNMESHIEFSRKWLEQAIEMPKKNAGIKELMLKDILQMKEQVSKENSKNEFVPPSDIKQNSGKINDIKRIIKGCGRKLYKKLPKKNK